MIAILLQTKKNGLIIISRLDAVCWTANFKIVQRNRRNINLFQTFFPKTRMQFTRTKKIGLFLGCRVFVGQFGAAGPARCASA